MEEDIKASVSIYTVAEEYGIDLKRVRKGRPPCPFCGSTTGFKVDRETYYKCFKCLKSGDIYTLLVEFGKAEDRRAAYNMLSKKNPPYRYSWAYEEIYEEYKEEERRTGRGAEYLRKRGIEIAVDIGYGREIKKSYPFNVVDMRGRVVFPIRSISGSLLHLQGRYTLEDGEVIRYLSTSWGQYPISKCFYNLNTITRLRPGDELYITEGIPDCLSLMQIGKTAIGSMGLELYLTGIVERLKGLKLIFVYDNDRDKNGVYKSWKRVVPAIVDLQTILGQEVYYLKPPEDRSGIKDCNEWLLEDPEDFGNCGEKVQPLEKLLTEMGEMDLLYRSLAHQEKITELYELVKDKWLATLLYYVKSQ